MKKIVVVVDDHVELFEGKTLTATISADMSGLGPLSNVTEVSLLLTVKDGTLELGVFQRWDYWRYTE